VGLVLGGLLTEYLDWRWTLYVNDVIAVPVLIGALVLIGRSVPAERPKLDILGAVLVSGGLFGIVYGFANAETHDWDNWMTWGFLAAGAVLLAAFFLWQTRAKHPVLPLRVLADRDRAAALSTVLISSAGMFGVLGAPVPRTAITLLDTAGQQLARATSRDDGSYEVSATEGGSLVLIGRRPATSRRSPP
jgi:uncharacterized membrane protein HdeD (DUF308 family)